MLFIQLQGSKPSRDQGLPGRGGVSCLFGAILFHGWNWSSPREACFVFSLLPFIVTYCKLTCSSDLGWKFAFEPSWYTVDTEDNVRWMLYLTSYYSTWCQCDAYTCHYTDSYCFVNRSMRQLKMRWASRLQKPNSFACSLYIVPTTLYHVENCYFIRMQLLNLRSKSSSSVISKQNMCSFF
jgi:hypothetical protein